MAIPDARKGGGMKTEELREIAATALAQIVREHGTTDGTYIQLGSKPLLPYLEAMAAEVARRTRQECVSDNIYDIGFHAQGCKTTDVTPEECGPTCGCWCHKNKQVAPAPPSASTPSAGECPHCERRDGTHEPGCRYEAESALAAPEESHG